MTSNTFEFKSINMYARAENLVSPSLLYNIKIMTSSKDQLDEGVVAEVRLYSLDGESDSYILLYQLISETKLCAEYDYENFFFVTDYLLLELTNLAKHGYIIAYELIDFSKKTFKTHIIQSYPLNWDQQDRLGAKAFMDIYIRE